MADLQRDRDSSTVVLEQINTVHQRGPDPSDGSTNSIIRVQEVLSLSRPACSGEAATLTKKPNYRLRKKKKKKSATEHVRFIIIESLENVQADLN